MSKRSAGRELNHDNWDDEEEAEEAGIFQKASDEALQGRVIKQARRRLAGNESETPKNVFAGFSGFGAPKATSTNAFSNLTFSKSSTSTETIPSSVSSSLTFNKLTSPTDSLAKENGNSKGTSKAEEENPSEQEYLANLKALNESVSSWISDHVKKNPCCVLSPVFKDYEKHLQDIESKRSAKPALQTTQISSSVSRQDKVNSTFGKEVANDKSTFSSLTPKASDTSPSSIGTSTTTTSSFSFGIKPATSSTTGFSFGLSASTSSTSSASSQSFSFKPPINTTAISSSSATTPTNSLFSFGSAQTPQSASTGFSFGFGSVKPPEKKSNEQEENGDEDDEDEPPKVEIKQVQEEDAFYSIKCKLFYKKDGNFAEKGVGMLHLKKIKDDKTQLIIRADTSLGNILLNILLHPQLTLQRVGKNNVMMVCIPNPPIDSKTAPVPTPMLLRVKTDTEADELLQKLNDAKK